jgi:disulfide oxidoreductase YuzD
VNAFSIHKTDKNTIYYSNGKSVITTVIYSKIGSDSEMGKDLNRIDKIVVKVNNKTVKTIKKDKGWNKSKYYPMGIIQRKILVNGNIKGKNVTIETYKNNKLIKSRTGTINNIPTKPTILSREDVVKAAKLVLKDYYAIKDKTNTKISKVQYLPESKIWDVTFKNTKTGKIVGGTYIDDITGKPAIM